MTQPSPGARFAGARILAALVVVALALAWAFHHLRAPKASGSTDGTLASHPQASPWPADQIIESSEGPAHSSLTSLFAALDTETDPDEKPKSLERLAESLPESELPAILDALAETDSHDASELRQILVRRWAESNLSAAAEWASRLPAGPADADAVVQVALAWADHDLSSALGWVTALAEGEGKQAALASVAYEAARTDPVAALNAAHTLPPSTERDLLLAFAASQWAASDPSAAILWVANLPDAVLREKMLAAVAIGSAEADGLTAVQLATQGLHASEEQERAAVAILQRWVQISPPAAASWLNQFPDVPLRQLAVRALVGVWATQDSRAAAAWLESLSEGSLRQSGLTAYAQTIASHPQAADQLPATSQVGTLGDTHQDLDTAAPFPH